MDGGFEEEGIDPALCEQTRNSAKFAVESPGHGCIAKVYSVMQKSILRELPLQLQSTRTLRSSVFGTGICKQIPIKEKKHENKVRFERMKN